MYARYGNVFYLKNVNILANCPKYMYGQVRFEEKPALKLMSATDCAKGAGQDSASTI